MNIGTFKRLENGSGFTGSIRTLNLSTGVTIRKVEKASEKAPDYRVVTSRGAEIGAGWEKAKEGEGTFYLSLKLDDPSFHAPIYANLTQTEVAGEYQLIWSRN